MYFNFLLDKLLSNCIIVANKCCQLTGYTLGLLFALCCTYHLLELRFFCTNPMHNFRVCLYFVLFLWCTFI